MKIELDIIIKGKYKIDAYSAGYVKISNKFYTTNLIVSPDKITENWSPKDYSSLTAEDFEQIISFSPEIVLLGTGLHSHFPADKVTDLLTINQIGFEIMDTGAACRSYNFLLSEGRQVVAALFMIDEQ